MKSNNNSLRRKKGTNSDLLELRDDFEQFRTTINSQLYRSPNSTNYTNSKNSPKTCIHFPKKVNIRSKNYNLLINKNVDENKNYNINFKIEEQIVNSRADNNIKKIKKVPYLNDKCFNKKSLISIKSLNKSKTQINFFSPDNSFKQLKNIFLEVSKTSKNSGGELNKKKLNKTNSFLNSKNNTIYFNSSLDNFYIKSKRDRFKTNRVLGELNKKPYSIFSPQSHCINFIGKLLDIYNKNKDNNKNKSKELTEDNNDKKFQYLGIDTFNQISLRNLFHKNKAKIKSGVLNNMIDDKNNNEKKNIILNPFSNSYGVLLNNLTEKVGFLKGSMDILYPQITQKRYQIRASLGKKKQIQNLKRSISQENFKNQNNGIKNNFFNFKRKKIIQSTFTKYPVSIEKLGQNIWTSKIYSFQGKKDLINKKVNKALDA